MNAESIAKRSLPSRAECEAIAIGHTGLDDFGDPYFRDGLDILLESLARDVSLTFIGRMMLRRAILTALEQRLRLVDLRKRDPQRLTAPMPAAAHRHRPAALRHDLLPSPACRRPAPLRAAALAHAGAGPAQRCRRPAPSSHAPQGRACGLQSLGAEPRLRST